MFKGYVALLDVLGFSAMVARDTDGKQVADYLRALEEAFPSQGRSSAVDYVVFSDSIILTTRDETVDSLNALVMGCSSLFGRLLDREISLRGAITHGPYIREKTESGIFVAGSAIIEAHEFERRQDWVGIMLTPSVLRHQPKLKEWAHTDQSEAYRDPNRCAELLKRIDWAAFLFNIEIPFKPQSASSPPMYGGTAIVPTHGQPEPNALLNSLNKSRERLLWLKSLAPTPDAQKKYDQTIHLMGLVRRIWKTVINTTG